MKRLRNRFSFQPLIVCWFCLVATMAYAQIASAPTAEKAKKVGSIIDQTGVSLGSCFYIDQRGYVATAFSNVERTSKLIVAFNDGNRFAVTGFVAACRGKDTADCHSIPDFRARVLVLHFLP